MRPKKPVKTPQDELFHVRLDVVCAPANPLVKPSKTFKKSLLNLWIKLRFFENLFQAKHLHSLSTQ